MSTGQRVRKSPEQRHREIREAAHTIAITSGLNEVTTRALASSVGSAPGLISYYVPSMDALRAEMFTQIVADELTTIRTQTASASDAIAAMGVLADTLFSEDRDPTTGIWLDGWSLGRKLNVIAEAVRDQMHAWQHFVVGLIEQGRTEGVFEVHDVDAAAWRIISLVDGLNAHSLVQYRTPEERSLLLAQAIEKEVFLPRGTLTQTKFSTHGGNDEPAATGI